MRPFSRIEPKAWEGETFKALRRRGSEALLVGLYLMSSPKSNMLGLYAQPILYMAHETGLGEDGAWKGLQGCIDVGFCSYDPDSEVVWVHEMARYQIGSELKAEDKRCIGAQRDYDAVPKNPFLGPFFDRYAEALHLTARRDFGDARQGSLLGGLEAPPQAPPKPRARARAGERAEASSPAKLPTAPVDEIIELYHTALPELPKVRLRTKDRLKAIEKLWAWVLTSTKSDNTRRAETPEQALSWIHGYFQRASENDFLMGRTPRTGEHANWRCDLDFLLTDRGMKHVIEKTGGAK